MAQNSCTVAMKASRQGARSRYVAASSGGASSSGRHRSRSPRRDPPATADLEAAEHYRTFVKKLCLTNKLSGAQTQQMSSLSTGAGSRGVADFGRAGKSGALPGNTSRDLLRSMVKGIPAPEPCMATILTRDPIIRPEQSPSRNVVSPRA